METINHLIAAVLTQRWAVPAILFAFAAAVVVILQRNYTLHYRGTRRALRSRLAAVGPVLDAKTIDDGHRAFAERYDEIDAAMRAEDGSHGLVHAWIEYSQTIVGQDGAVLQATTRPYDYFLHLGDDTRVLAWWANLFVALGLTFTFLGIIGALTTTTDGMREAGANPGAMSATLVTLLTITATKFWTSVAGVVASIVLRYVDRRWHSATLQDLQRLADAIERGTCYLPPQRIAADQLHELKGQRAALSSFSSQLAVGIADALEAKMQPVVLGLSGIQSSIDEFKSGSFDQIGKELGTAISQGAGTEMAAFAGALTTMTEKLAGVNERVDATGAAASEQIAAAAQEFSAASDAMTRAFTSLNERVDAVGSRIAGEMEQAASRNGQLLREERARFEGLGEAQRTQMAALSDSLTASVGEAAARNREALTGAAAALEQASARTAVGMRAAMTEVLSAASAESEAAIKAAFAQFSDAFRESSAGLVDTLRQTALRMEALAASVERSTGAADSHAGKLAEAGREAQAVASVLRAAANDVGGVAQPLAKAVEAVGRSVGQSEALLREANRHGAEQAAQVRAVADSFKATSAAAERAWSEYRGRFADVDKALGEALERIKAASGEHAGALNEQVGRIDTALAKAVDKLSASLDPLTDLAEALESERLRSAAE